jgi:predicted GTPase
MRDTEIRKGKEMARRIIIMGAAGKDFHVFNTCYRGNSEYNIVAFTATQIPWIVDRSYPAELSGELYPTGIPIHDEVNLESLIREYSADECVFAYSDVSYDFIEKQRNRVRAAGAAFSLAPVEPCMVPSTKPVVAIVAVRTGCGKSQTTRRVRDILNAMGRKTVAARHPMPYGELNLQKVQRFASIEDLKKHKCTIEEMEEYEPHIINNTIVYAGVDYEAILREAEKEADVVLWDGGNNDIPFFKPDLYITVVDPHRAGDELRYYPSDENFKRADVIVFNKMDTAPPEGAEIIKRNVAEHNPGAIIVYANSPATIEDENAIKGKRVLVVEDGPTCTHGGMKIGAGTVAAEKYGAAEIIDPRPYLVGTLKDTFSKYPEIGNLLPAMGYSGEQIEDLEKTINATDCDVVVIGTPIDLRRLITIDKPSVRVFYNLEVTSEPSLEDIIKEKLG